MKLLFYGYLGLILYLYVKEVPDLNTPESLTDKHMHFIVFFILGSIAQVINGKDNNFSFGVSLALIVSLFIETLHFFLPYRDFEIFDGVFNGFLVDSKNDDLYFRQNAHPIFWC